MNEGNWISVSRELWNDPDFDDGPMTQREAWLWMIAEAAWRPRKVRRGRQVLELQRGQLAHSIRFMSDAWGWSKSAGHRFLKKLEKRDAIRIAGGTDATVITICNYDRYQSSNDDSGTLAGHQAGHWRDTGGTNENKDNKTTLLCADADVRESAPADEPENPKPAPVTADDLDRAVQALMAAAGPGLGDPAKHHGLLLSRSEIGRWMRAGVDIELDAVPVVQARTAQPRASPITSWTYFTPAVGEAAARRLSDMTLPEIPHDRSGHHTDTRRPQRGEPRRSATGGYGGNRMLEACLGLIGDGGA